MRKSKGYWFIIVYGDKSAVTWLERIIADKIWDAVGF